jgi:hypothetical protein
LNGKSWKKQPLSLGAKKGSKLALHQNQKWAPLGHQMGTAVIRLIAKTA